MRVLQLIDSLSVGGAERMAVNIANALAARVDRSYLCATRKEGLLKDALSPEVGYLYLDRKRTLDWAATSRLLQWIKIEQIDIIHAHSTSYFLATWLKLRLPSLRIIWHEHHGNRITQGASGNRVLIGCSRRFDQIITVNQPLQAWAHKHLKCKKVAYLPNFVEVPSSVPFQNEREDVIVSLANLRQPKNHLLLIRAFHQVQSQFPDWRLQLIGGWKDDSYFQELNHYIETNNLGNFVALMGAQSQVDGYLSKAKIGVLSSDMEGLPMALLEYGASGIAVLVTDVGQCREVVANHGFVVPPSKVETYAQALIELLSNEAVRTQMALDFHQHVKARYSMESVLETLIELYKNVHY